MAPDTGGLMKSGCVLAAAVCLQLVLVYAPRVLAQQPAAQPAPAAQALAAADADPWPRTRTDFNRPAGPDPHASRNVISSHQAGIFAFFARYST
jgi:hypothetical protein